MAGGAPRDGRWRFAGATSRGSRPPALDGPEVAVAGRSNVGKSSLINCLTRTKGLARTSATPGRTQQINFFAGPGPMVLVDLPGYGYAAAPLQVRASWGRSVEEYLTTRESLCGVVLVIDARRGMRDTDRAALEVLEASGRAVVVVVNKVDKLRMGDRSRRMAEIAAEVAEPLAFSAVTGEGKAALWRRLAGLAALR